MTAAQRQSNRQRVIALVSWCALPLSAVACAQDDSSGEADEVGASETSSGETNSGEATSDTTGAGEASTGGDDGCPEPDPDFLSYFFYFGHPDWPYAPYVLGQDPPQEFGICTISKVGALPDEQYGDFIDLEFSCIHEDNNEYPQRLLLVSNPSHDAAVDSWQELGPLELRFLDSTTWDDHIRFQHLSIRDGEGRLLFVGIHSTPPPATWDGAKLGAPPGLDSAKWYAPFSSFTVHDRGCQPVDVVETDYLSFAYRVRRLAVDFEFDGETLTLYDKNSALGVETSDGRYDLFVGQAFEIIETFCGDCVPVHVYFHMLRQPETP